MTICSLVVHARPDRAATVRDRLREYQGVEVHAVSEKGKLVVTIDHSDPTHCSETMMAMHNIDGVLSAALVYEYRED